MGMISRVGMIARSTRGIGCAPRAGARAGADAWGRRSRLALATLLAAPLALSPAVAPFSVAESARTGHALAQGAGARLEDVAGRRLREVMEPMERDPGCVGTPSGTRYSATYYGLPRKDPRLSAELRDRIDESVLEGLRDEYGGLLRVSVAQSLGSLPELLTTSSTDQAAMRRAIAETAATDFAIVLVPSRPDADAVRLTFVVFGRGEDGSYSCPGTSSLVVEANTLTETRGGSERGEDVFTLDGVLSGVVRRNVALFGPDGVAFETAFPRGGGCRAEAVLRRPLRSLFFAALRETAGSTGNRPPRISAGAPIAVRVDIEPVGESVARVTASIVERDATGEPLGEIDFESRLAVVPESATRGCVGKVATLEAPPTLQLSADRAAYRAGEAVTFSVTTDRACHLTVLSTDEAGATVLFPNRWTPANRIEPGATFALPEAEGGFRILAPEGSGAERVIALCDADAESPAGIAHAFEAAPLTEIDTPVGDGAALCPEASCGSQSLTLDVRG